MRMIQMKPRSAKNKGVRLQNWVRDKILKYFPELEDTEVKCAIMGEGGMDIKLSPDAQESFPFAVECKNSERLNVYKAYDQACENAVDLEPLLIIKKNQRAPLAVVDAEAFIELVKATDLVMILSLDDEEYEDDQEA